MYTHRAIENPLHVETVAESSRDNPDASLFYPHILGCRAYDANKIKNLCETPVESVFINQTLAECFEIGTVTTKELPGLYR